MRLITSEEIIAAYEALNATAKAKVRENVGTDESDEVLYERLKSGELDPNVGGMQEAIAQVGIHPDATEKDGVLLGTLAPHGMDILLNATQATAPMLADVDKDKAQALSVAAAVANFYLTGMCVALKVMQMREEAEDA
jgi:hypothetical protein